MNFVFKSACLALTSKANQRGGTQTATLRRSQLLKGACFHGGFCGAFCGRFSGGFCGGVAADLLADFGGFQKGGFRNGGEISIIGVGARTGCNNSFCAFCAGLPY